MNNSTLHLKPLALILATAFPFFAHATPSVSASGNYQYAGYIYDPADVVNITGNFAQNATSEAFSQTETGGPATYSWIFSDISAAADGLGHFGSSIQNGFSFPQGLTQKASTVVTLTDTITNNTAATQNVSFNFNIDTLSITTHKGIELSNSPMTNTASFIASIDVNGSTAWSAAFFTQQIDADTVLWKSTGADIGLGSQSIDPGCSTGYFSSCNFSLQNYTNTLALGSLAANASLTVTYTVKLDTETNAYGGSSDIYFSDPTGISAGNAGSNAPLSASLQFATSVPEPEQSSMLLAGLALVGVAAKRRHKPR